MKEIGRPPSVTSARFSQTTALKKAFPITLHLRETPIQERLKIETTATFPLLHVWLNSSRPFSKKPKDKLSETIGFLRENLNILQDTFISITMI